MTMNQKAVQWSHKLKKLNLTNYERDFGVANVGWKVLGSEEKIEEFKTI